MSTMTAEMMRAISPTAWGGAELLAEIATPKPVPGATEVLVRVRAAGVNPTDFKQRVSGGLGLWGDPPILGYDVSGVVEAVGLGVTLHAPGDEVFGMPHFPRQAGAYAEYVVAPARQFAPKPATLDHVQAAALPLTALTAWQVLVDTADVQPGQRVLIHAAAGGLGHVAVQIAKARGAHVIGTASAPKHELLRALGADELVDYTATPFESVVADVDVVLDTIGGDYGARSLETLRAGGILVCLASPFDPGDEVAAQAAARGVRVAAPLVEPDRLALTEIAALVEAGALRPVIDTVLPLAEARRAHELGESGRTTGKIVLTVD
ncbi:Narbonolide/10-deoxymethynolide synthase PikA2, modules 3 and 4 [Baekduia alba]|uniref:NADP-dependent oxidoreductase n=1 Tax=Baekduia alba TaxID=2997333 RepID=UPI00233FDCA3|nr:NADP-dependent oxidoreductase [Baekduia alba]WCB95342.1 Narbonolide/10-deoxymethynolide synthase PikA2, modules 3 and 4 [Baekduia alba]